MSKKIKVEEQLIICTECKYIHEYKVGKIFKKIMGTLCSAQGFRSTASCYNTNECKKLFKKKEIN
jgi:hypothetical protein